MPNRKRYGEPTVQSRARQLLQTTEKFELDSLKDSILTNGFVPLEQIVVEAYDEDDQGKRYLVIEGNRRLAAIKSLLEDHDNGIVTIDKEKLYTIKKFSVYEIKGTDDEKEEFKQTLMAIRHIAGIRVWGPYQQAKLVAELYEQEEYSFNRVAQRIGIRSNEVARRYRAIKALQQMEEDEEYGGYAAPKLYALFHEAVSQPKVRDWIGWSDETFSAQNLEGRRGLYSLFVVRNVDGETLPEKIKDVRDVRKLKEIVDKDAPLSILLDPEKEFEEAYNAAKSQMVTGSNGRLEQSIAQAIQQLNQPGIEVWLNPTDSDREVWKKLMDLVTKLQSFMEH